MYQGGPAGTGTVAVTVSVAVSNTETVPASRCAISPNDPSGASSRCPGVGPTATVPRTVGTAMLAATARGAAAGGAGAGTAAAARAGCSHGGTAAVSTGRTSTTE